VQSLVDVSIVFDTVLVLSTYLSVRAIANEKCQKIINNVWGVCSIAVYHMIMDRCKSDVADAGVVQ